ncbi:hypothetical protein PIB30_049029 [Stylosanthes scabra]|uniref:Uncharacterized protein n=1 Tax=Stylosanthes scabra TaxID=79078 RepID=A0ABU6SHA5_9FABA|nr:hypothetical protein [Stylosanthes scabra]
MGGCPSIWLNRSSREPVSQPLFTAYFIPSAVTNGGGTRIGQCRGHWLRHQVGPVPWPHPTRHPPFAQSHTPVVLVHEKHGQCRPHPRGTPFWLALSLSLRCDTSDGSEKEQKKMLSEQSSWETKDTEGRDYLYRLGKEADNMNIAVGQCALLTPYSPAIFSARTSILCLIIAKRSLIDDVGGFLGLDGIDGCGDVRRL